MSLFLAKSLGDIKGYVDKPGSRVVLMASATFCMPCKRITPVFEEVASELEGKFVAIKVNLDESPDVNDWLGVGSVPTFIYWKDGKEVYRAIGGCSKESFIAQINKLFN